MMFRSSSSRTAMALLVGAAAMLSGCGVLGGKDKPKTPTLGQRIPILSRVESGARLDPALAAVAVVLPPEEANADWPQAGGTASKSYGHLALGASPRLAWSAKIAGSSSRARLAASPVVGDGRVYVIDTAGQVSALDARNGSRLWSKDYAFKGDGSRAVFGGGVSFDSGRVYVTTGTGEVAALEAESGKSIWQAKPAGPLRGSPTIAFNAVFVMTQDNQVHALDIADGKPLWNESASTGQTGVFGVAAPAAGQGTVIAGFSSGELIAFRYENGRTVWSDALARTSLSTQVGVLTDVDADPIIDRGRVYALGQGGRMAAYELITGQRIWELNLAGISTPAIAGDWIFTLTDEGKLLCIARTSGKVRWLTELPRYQKPKKRKGPIFWTGPVLAGNRLWIGNSLGEVSSVDPAEGKVTPFVEVDDPVTLAPVVAGGTLYVLDDSGRIGAYR